MKRKHYVIPAAVRRRIAEDNPPITFKWTVNRGRDTYGYIICSLYIRGRKTKSCSGGGYCMTGTCLGEWIEDSFPEYLKKLDPAKFYGLSFYKPGSYRRLKHGRPGCIARVNGACGFSSMEKILEKLGFYLTSLESSANITVYALRAF